ncbi:hypothetical protein HDU86_004941 [Geranomyces michiganensis]|nr:hypothetical protein HDU86_004941 [Geranomyces michiganensis]
MFDELLCTLPKTPEAGNEKIAQTGLGVPAEPVPLRLAESSGLEEQQYLRASISQASSLGASSSVDITDFFTREATADEKPEIAKVLMKPQLSELEATATPPALKTRPPPPAPLIIVSDSASLPIDNSSVQSTPRDHLAPTASPSDGFSKSFAAAAETSRSNLSVHVPTDGSHETSPSPDAALPPKSRKTRPSLRKLLRHRSRGSTNSPATPPPASPECQPALPSPASSEQLPIVPPALPFLPQIRRRSHVYSQRRSVSHAGAVAENTPLDIDHLAGNGSDSDQPEQHQPFSLATTPFSETTPHLDLSSRNLSHFPALTSPGDGDGGGGGRFQALTELHIVNNWIAHIPPGALKGLPNLVVLDVSQNLLTDLPAELAELVAMREIYARENRLAGVPPELEGCTELRVCDLGRNRITDLSVATPLLEAMGRIDDLSLASACGSPSSPEGPSADSLHQQQPSPATTVGTPRSVRRRIQSMPTASSGSIRTGSWTSTHLRRLENLFADKNTGGGGGGGVSTGPSASGSMRTVVEPADASCEGLFGGPKSIQDIYTEDPAEADEGIAPSSGAGSRRTSLPPQSPADALEDGDPNAPPFGLKMRQKGSRRRPGSPSYGPRTSSLPATASTPTGTGSERSPQKQRFSLFGGSRSSLRGSNAAGTSSNTSPTRTNSGGSNDSERQTHHLRQLLNCLRDAYDLDPRVRAPGSGVDILDPAHGDADGAESESGSVSDEGRSAARMAKKQQNPDRRQKVAVEILSTEQTYVRQLEALMEVYVRPIEEKLLLNPQELNAIFANVKSILLFHSDYYNNFDAANRLVSQLESSSSSPAAASVYMSSSTPAAQQPFGGSKASAKRFREFVASAKNDARHTQASLQSFLILPVQRLPRYKLLVDELFECTSPQHPDYLELKRAREEVRRRVAECNEKKREWEARESGLTVLERVLPRSWSTGVDAFSHVRPGRRFVRDGTLKVLKCVEFAGAASGHARIDALQACAGKKERFRQRVIGHLIETRFGSGSGEKEELGAAAAAASGTGVSGDDIAGGGGAAAGLGELRLAGISGRLFHFFLFTDVLCWCRAKAGADGRHDLIQGMGIGLGNGVELTEVEGGGDKKRHMRQGVLRVRSPESILYLIGDWEQMVEWRDACNGGSS